MTDPTAHDLVLALQNNPEVLADALGELKDTTACGWETLGRLHFRRRLRGDVLGWVREPLPKRHRHGSWTCPSWIEFGITKASADHSHHVAQDIDLHNSTEVSSPGEARARIDWHLERRYWFLTTLPSGLPITTELVASAGGLIRPDLFQMLQAQRTMRGENPMANPGMSPRTVLGRAGGLTTRRALQALTWFLEGKNVRVVVMASERREHFTSLFRTLVQCVGAPSLECLVFLPNGLVGSNLPLYGEVWVLTPEQLRRLSASQLNAPDARFLFDL